jgi:hypothetical protein
MMLFYLDSSAWVKRYFRELGSGWINQQFEQQVVLGGSTLGLRGADSVHLASALLLQTQLGISNHDFNFVSSDQELNVAARAAGLSVIDPEHRI